MRRSSRGWITAAGRRWCDIAAITVPYEAQNALLETLRDALQGKVLVDVNAFLQATQGRPSLHPVRGFRPPSRPRLSSGKVAVVGAFQNVSAEKLDDLESAIDCDVLVTGDDRAAKRQAMDLAEAIGACGIDAGPLVNAKAVEAMTSVLIGINIRYKVHGPGIRITGLP